MKNKFLPEDSPWFVISNFFYSLGQLAFKLPGQASAGFLNAWNALGGLFSGSGYEASFDVAPDGSLELSATLSMSSEGQGGLSAPDIEGSGTLQLDARVRENGIIEENIYEDGFRIAKRFVDVNDVEAWSTIENTYDQSGRTTKVTEFDTGVVRTDTFQDGVRRTTTVDDTATDIADWESRESIYGADGFILAQSVSYDDGIRREDSFVNGVRTEAVFIDLADSNPDWTVRRNEYDTNGNLISVFFEQDDGTLRTDEFANGSRTTSVETDPSDTAEWSLIETTYDPSGQALTQTTDFDTLDRTVLIYQNGERDVRVEQDNDGSDAWEFRVTTYDASGVSSVESFTSASDLPAQYLPFFEDPEGPPPGDGGIVIPIVNGVEDPGDQLLS